jgi:Tfp pilus assembly protein PilO
LPQKKEISKLLNDISEEKKKFDIEVLSFNTQKENFKDFYAEIPLSFILKGNFNNIMLFLDNLRFKNRLLIPRKVHLLKQKDFKIKAECTIMTYRLLTEKEKNQKREKSKKR